MLDMKILLRYQCWLNYFQRGNESQAKRELYKELKHMKDKPKRIEEAFYKEVTFGTGGIRGIMGAGCNRINICTIAKATQGVADYIRKQYPQSKWRAVVSYDSRIHSELFAQITCEVFAANEITALIFPQLMPTPCLSFAIRETKCVAGVMITASHNASSYNGYKVYNEEGCQITDSAANMIAGEIDKLDIFRDVHKMQWEEGIRVNRICYLPETIEMLYLKQVKAQTLIEKSMQVDRSVAIVYSPLNGTGMEPVTRLLREVGYDHVTVVEEQRNPDGHFPTCPYPNPESREAMELAITYAKREQADLVLATDPDCDRVGIAVRSMSGEYVLLSGNETGILLLDYICFMRLSQNRMPRKPVMMKSIVTTNLAEVIAASYGVESRNVLTGFKYIGEQIGRLEQEGRENSFLFGFEESYGYLTGSYVRDKDGVLGVYLISEMYTYYKAIGKSLIEVLQELYQKYGFFHEVQHSYELEGRQGQEQMKQIMNAFRQGRISLGNQEVVSTIDYQKEQRGFIPANMIRYGLSDKSTIVIRPSGTEPKLKIYLSICSKDLQQAKVKEQEIMDSLFEVIRMNITNN